jgi:hypothetical protein
VRPPLRRKDCRRLSIDRNANLPLLSRATLVLPSSPCIMRTQPIPHTAPSTAQAFTRNTDVCMLLHLDEPLTCKSFPRASRAESVSELPTSPGNGFHQHCPDPFPPHQHQWLRGRPFLARIGAQFSCRDIIGYRMAEGCVCAVGLGRCYPLVSELVLGCRWKCVSRKPVA